MSTEENEQGKVTNSKDREGLDEHGLGHVTHLSDMYESWFLDYASYVILERAVPSLADGLKPVQRRILHSMKRMDDGRYNKGANIIGHTMQFHPHGDAAIGDALVQLGQKDLLIDTQGNWGNTYTGDGAAAPRYIEARLSKFALEVLFSPKITEWQLSYDGRNREPIALPAKFPLLLAQGVEGIAVGLASRILPHNFVELLDSAMAYLKDESFELFPDFPTGGLVDIGKYQDGIRGGQVRVRAKIEKRDTKTLAITELPYGRTTGSLIESILKANEKGKIKIKRIDDNTAEHVEIIINLASKISPDQTIDALYATTDCEISISPNSCVIQSEKPCFSGVSELLKESADYTVQRLKAELLVRQQELEEEWHLKSLEKIFIEEGIYKDKEYEEAATVDHAIKHIAKRLQPFAEKLVREITHDDILRLLEIRMKRILKFSASDADKAIKALETELKKVKRHIKKIIPYAIAYYEEIKKKYGKGRERKTEIRNFENIEATRVVVANEKLYINREEGFIGTSLKRNEYLFDCSDLDDILIVRKDGTYNISKVSEKLYVGKDVLHVRVYDKRDERTIFNVVFRDGRGGATRMKRCAITGLMRDKEYCLTKGTTGSRILHLSVNPNGEAEKLRVTLKPKPRLKSLHLFADFKDIAIKGRSSQGNIITKNEVYRIVVAEQGASTLSGLKVWFDPSINRLNTDGHGTLLGEFLKDEKILMINVQGNFHFYGYDLSTHFADDEMIRIEKYVKDRVFSLIYWDAEKQYYYLKRFELEPSMQLGNLLNDNLNNRLVAVSSKPSPRFQITFGGKHRKRKKEVIDAEEFIAVKGYTARGKRLTTFEVANIVELDTKASSAPDVCTVPAANETPSIEEGAAIRQKNLFDHLEKE